ncbi:MAG: NADH-quinone oxidoreductase subunit J [Oligoflexia bacterium]|nr:NADH-quinone oxidoreductase subunit J [Oligoflexia bacterium]
MIIAFLATATLAAVTVAAFVRDIRRATLALWIAGLGAGGIYLTIGAETLAIVQWVTSTLVAISFVFFAVMFGEYGSQKGFFDRKRALFYGLGLAIGVSFAGLIALGSGTIDAPMLEVPVSGNDLPALGKALTEDHLLSLEVLAFTLLMVLVGGGVLARPEPMDRGERKEELKP